MTPAEPEQDRTEITSPPPVPSTDIEPGFHKTEVYVPPPKPAAPDMGNGLPVGTRLHEFEITRLVGEGGFGIVYLAMDTMLKRRVALKEYMPTSLAARDETSQVQVKSERYRETFDAGMKSFINEAQLLASFDHPSLVKVYRFWEQNGTAYMVMPFYEGKNLRDTLRAMPGAPSEDWLRTLLQPLTEALQVIHAQNCYHRDIAPDNVMMLADTGRPLLLDFGAARRVIGDMTQALTVILKPGYAPVEQYAEIPGMKQGAWTDVYALAAVVHYAITGRTPPPSVGRLLNDTYQPLAQVAAGRYSADFLAAVDRALAVRPETRTQSVAQLRQEMRLDGAANLEELKSELEPMVNKCLSYFPGVDRSVGGWEGLMAAQQCLPDNEMRDKFASDFSQLAIVWEALSPDPILSPFEDDYRWLVQVYESLKPPSGNGKLLWHALGAKTIKLIHENVTVQAVRDDLETLVMDADVIQGFIDDPETGVQEVEIRITARLRRNIQDPKFVALSERLESLRLKHEQGLLASLDFLKSLLELARDVVEAENEVPEEVHEEQGKAALTELFESVKTDATPVIVERVVGDIDEIVRQVRFPGWQQTEAGERELRKALRRSLLKYKLHTDQDLFDRAYGYIVQYY